MKQKIILTDADGVLVEWNTGFANWMTAKGYPQKPNTETEYSMAIRHGISTHEAHEFIKEFNEGPAISDLKPFADSIPFVNKIANLGFRFIVVTSISSHPNAKFYRTQNLKSLFGDVFDDIHCIEMGASKANILLENWADTGYFWIEDHMRQAEAGWEAGLKTVLINHPYNSHFVTDLFPRVSYESPWEEIFNMVRKEYQI